MWGITQWWFRRIFRSRSRVAFSYLNFSPCPNTKLSLISIVMTCPDEIVDLLTSLNQNHWLKMFKLKSIVVHLSGSYKPHIISLLANQSFSSLPMWLCELNQRCYNFKPCYEQTPQNKINKHSGPLQIMIFIWTVCKSKQVLLCVQVCNVLYANI